MNNQHAGLSQTLADQHITGQRDHATRQRLKLVTRQPRRRRTPPPHRHWWQLARPTAVAADQPTRRPHSVS